MRAAEVVGHVRVQLGQQVQHVVGVGYLDRGGFGGVLVLYQQVGHRLGIQWIAVDRHRGMHTAHAVGLLEQGRGALKVGRLHFAQLVGYGRQQQKDPVMQGVRGGKHVRRA